MAKVTKIGVVNANAYLGRWPTNPLHTTPRNQRTVENLGYTNGCLTAMAKAGVPTKNLEDAVRLANSPLLKGIRTFVNRTTAVPSDLRDPLELGHQVREQLLQPCNRLVETLNTILWDGVQLGNRGLQKRHKDIAQKIFAFSAGELIGILTSLQDKFAQFEYLSDRGNHHIARMYPDITFGPMTRYFLGQTVRSSQSGFLYRGGSEYKRRLEITAVAGTIIENLSFDTLVLFAHPDGRIDVAPELAVPKFTDKTWGALEKRFVSSHESGSHILFLPRVSRRRRFSRVIVAKILDSDGTPDRTSVGELIRFAVEKQLGSLAFLLPDTKVPAYSPSSEEIEAMAQQIGRQKTGRHNLEQTDMSVSPGARAMGESSYYSAEAAFWRGMYERRWVSEAEEALKRNHGKKHSDQWAKTGTELREGINWALRSPQVFQRDQATIPEVIIFTGQDKDHLHVFSKALLG